MPSSRGWVGWAAGLAALGATVVVGAGVVGRRAPAALEPAAVDLAALATVDLPKIHQELIGAWIVAEPASRAERFDAIVDAAGGDPALEAILDGMRDAAGSDPVGRASELLALVRAWNGYLERGGEPWRLAGEVRVGGDDGGRFLLKAYQVIFDGGEVAVAGRPFAAELRRRVDGTTLSDGWLGQMHDHTDGVVVLVDPVTALALDEVWPMLDPELDADPDVPFGPLMRAFAPAVRAELADALTPAEMDALRATAEDRWWMGRAAAAIHGRRACGSAFYVSRIPWNGMSGRDLSTLQAAASSAASRGDDCPDVTETEALVFAVRTSEIRRTPGVYAAIERLIGHVAASVAVHEARHAADDAALAGRALSCSGCPSGTSETAALEASAYVASFAHAGTGALALYQACALDPATTPELAAVVAFLAGRLSPGGCADGPPSDLSTRAAALEAELFGRSEPIALTTFPDRLAVPDPEPR